MKLRQLFSLLIFAAVASGQQFTEPGWFQVEIDNGYALPQQIPRGSETGGGGGGELLSFPEIAEAITPEIEALARGLENDPKRIFDYVHDNIRYVHYFGSKKGAQLTLLERSGNDFDQCALLVALLRAAGHTANYRFGLLYLPYEDTTYHLDFKHWLGLTKPKTNLTEALNFAVALNRTRGFPLADAYYDGTDDLYLHRVWVRLNWNSEIYVLDPAFKVSEPITGINLATAMQLSTNTLMTVAAGTTTADYVQNLDESALRNKLRDYTTNLLFDIQTYDPNASVEDTIGGQWIRSSVGWSFEDLEFDWPFGFTTNATVDWTYIPTNFMTTLNVRVDGTNQFLRVPELQGQRLSLTFSTNGLAQLWLDDDLLLQKQTSGGSTVDVVLSIDHPHGSWNTTNNTLTNSSARDHSVTNSYQRTNASYAICYAFEADPRWLRQRQERLDAYRASGLSDTNREVVTETLNIMGMNWMLQTEWMARLLAPDQQMLVQNHHRLGRMGQESGKGYYIDIYQWLTGILPASGNGAADVARRSKVFEWSSYLESAAEHGLIEQLQSSNLVAASTVKMLQKANANGHKIFQAKSSNWTIGSNVRGQLTNYSTATLDSFGSAIAAGYTILLPQNGSNVIAGAGTWAGYGAVLRHASDMQMLISGKYSGGFVSTASASVNPPYVAETAVSQPTYFNPAPSSAPSLHVADPVSIVDGAFHISTSDLSVGGAEPRGFRFGRHYSSSRRNHNLAGMANGWLHNYHFDLAEVSAPMAGLGTTTPAQAAAMIVAAKSSYELYLTNGTPKHWAVTALIAKWAIDHLTSNAVSVSLGPDTLQFVRQPNGALTPPAGSTMTLTKSGSAYNLSERHGNTFKFSSAGLLTNIVDQYNQSLSIEHNSSNWVSQVKDWKNRTLTFNYSGTPQRLASIADSTGRTVSYGYAQGDLSSVTDPESKTSTFIYDHYCPVKFCSTVILVR